jgi:hypothetical protein
MDKRFINFLLSNMKEGANMEPINLFTNEILSPEL